jgi:hypothetical protein
VPSFGHFGSFNGSKTPTDRHRYQVLALRAPAQEPGAREALLFPNRLIVFHLLRVSPIGGFCFWLLPYPGFEYKAWTATTYFFVKTPLETLLGSVG